MTEAFSRLSDSEFKYVHKASECSATKSMRQDFEQNGFVIARQLFNPVEVDKILTAVDSSREFWQANFSLSDKDQLKFAQTLWTEPGNDILGLACKCAKLAGVAEQLLNKGEVYLYHAKIVMKAAQHGGSLLWHQDYGYWYFNRALFPNFITCIIALTKSDRENGGLKVIKQSQLCGRVDHFQQAGQTAADPERVELIQKQLETVTCDLKPGDVVFFHANMLHSSDANFSEFKRWHLIFSFNTKENCSAMLPHYSAIYGEPMKKVSADAVLNCDNLELNARKYGDPNENPNINLNA